MERENPVHSKSSFNREIFLTKAQFLTAVGLVLLQRIQITIFYQHREFTKHVALTVEAQQLATYSAVFLFLDKANLQLGPSLSYIYIYIYFCLTNLCKAWQPNLILAQY